MRDFQWDPAQYQAFADHRSRPFHDLVGQVRAAAPRQVVDLGCGPGTMTATLAQRWPQAQVWGLDSSAEMIAAAQASLTEDDDAGPGADVTDRVRFRQADARSWMPDAEVDVVVSNAMLQWIPGHRSLLESWLQALRPGGWLAVQVPGNFAAPSHEQIGVLARDPRFRTVLSDVTDRESVYTPVEYVESILGSGCQANVWETTYHQALPGEDPVYEWVRGAALRPALQRLAAADERDGTALQEEFIAEYRERMRVAYPPISGTDGLLTDYPFRRIFLVAHRPSR